MSNNISISKYIATNKTSKIITLTDLKGSPSIGPKKSVNLLKTSNIVEIEKSRSLTEAIRSNKVSIRVVDNNDQIKLKSNILLQDDLDQLVLNNISRKSVEKQINFSSEDTKQVVIPADGVNKRILRILWYINQDPGSDVFQQPNLSFFVNSDFKDSNLLWKAQLDLIYTEIGSGAPSGSTSIILDDPSDFSEDDLVYFLSNQEFRRIDSVDVSGVNLIDPVENSYNVDDGFSRVAEAGGFSVYDTSNNTNDKFYIQAKFDSNQTLNTKIKIIYV